MEVRRISPEDGILRELLNQRKRLRSVETRPSGNIVIRETLSAYDPEKGRDILFGLLPDGSYGIDPWFGDTIPPNVPSAPTVKGVVGGLLVEWNGLDEYGMGQPDDYSYTLVQVSSDNRATWKFGTKITNTAPNATIGLLPGEYFVRLQSFDFKGNASDFSVYTSGTALSVLDNEDIQDALEDQRNAMDDLEQELNTNNNAQRQLQTDMTALRNRVSPVESGLATIRDTTIPNIQTSINGKNSIFRETTAPASNNTRGVAGDRWEQWSSLAVGGKLLKTFRKSTGNVWIEEAIDPVYIPKIDIGSGTFGTLSGGRLEANTVTTKEMVVGSFDNLITNGRFDYGATGWAGLNAQWTVQDTGGRITPKVLRCTGITERTFGPYCADIPLDTQGNLRDATNPNDVKASQASYRVSGWVKTTAPTSRAELCIYTYTHNGTFRTNRNFNIDTATNEWKFFSTIMEVPGLNDDRYKDAAYFRIRVNAVMTDAAHEMFFDDLSIVKANDGTLTVNGSIKAEHIDSKSIAADIGQFLTISTDQLVAGRVQMDVGVANKLFADIITGRKFYTSQLVIGHPGNMIPDPGFNDAEQLARINRSSTCTVDLSSSTDLRIANTGTGSTYLRPYGTAQNQNAVLANEWISVEPGQVWEFGFTRASWKGTTGWAKFVGRTLDGAEYVNVPQTKHTNGTAIPTGNGEVRVESVIPANCYWIIPEVMIPPETQWSYIKRNTMYLREMVTPNLIVDGSITAKKLETDLVLATKIVAGIPTGTRAEMSPNGFRVFAQEPGSSTAATEVIRMGVAETDDYFAVTRSDGTPVATISQNGDISGQNIYANEGLYYRGYDLLDILGDIPRGVVARGYHDFGGNGAAANILIGSNSWYGIATTSFIPEANRTYQLVFKQPMIASSAGGESQWAVRYRWVSQTDTSAPTQANTVLQDQFIRTFPGAGSWHNAVWVSNLDSGTANIGKRLQILITAWCGPSGNSGYFRVFNAATLTICDMGTTSPEPVYHTSAGGSQYQKPADPPPPVRQKYTKQYACTNSMNYQGNNSQYVWNTGKMIQGPSPAGVGNTKSIGIFPNWQGDISGATINNIRVIFNFEHWYYNGGGTARIGVHGHTGIPGTFSHAGVVATSANWPKPGARWVTLPTSTYVGFANGSYRGVSLEGDGTYTTYGYSARPTIEITYTK